MSRQRPTAKAPPRRSLACRLYRSFYRIRRVEEEVARIYPTDAIKSPVHLSIGQEAISVGVCEALRPTDVVFGSYRGHAMYLAKGGDLKAMMAELYGKATGCARGKGGSMHLIDTGAGVMGTSAVVATTIPLAAGYAFSLKVRGSDAVVASFFGDGAVDEGGYHETMNFAALKKLPVLFVCENNSFAIHSHHLTRRHADNLCERGRSSGMPARLVGNPDTREIRRVSAALVGRIRKGEGPAFLECLTCRWKEHVGPGEDHHLGYRDEADVRSWMERDDLSRLRALLPEESARGIEYGVEEEIAAAIRFAEGSPFPPAGDLWTDVYGIS